MGVLQISKDDALTNFLEMEDFSKEYFTKGRSEATSLLMLNSCVEVAIKKAVKLVIIDAMQCNTPIEQAVLIYIMEGLEGESISRRSALLKVIRKSILDSNIRERDLNRLANMNRLRNRIAHATCRYIDRKLRQIEDDFSDSLDQCWESVEKVVSASFEFSSLHQTQKDEFFKALSDEMAGDAYATESKLDYYDD